MAVWNKDNVVFTTKGEEALSKVVSGQGKLTVTRIVTGSGYVSSISSLKEQTRVSDIKQTFNIVRVTTDSNGSEISMNLNNNDLDTGYYMYQIGVYCKHSDSDSEFLYLIAQCDTSNPDYIPSHSETPVTLSYNLYVQHKGTSNFEVTVNSAGIVTVSMINQPNGVVGLDADCRMLDKFLPSGVAHFSDLVDKPSYLYVEDGTNLTDLISSEGIHPFWSMFTSTQGPSSNKCMYFVYPVMSSSGTYSGGVFIEAFDITRNLTYVYSGTYSSISNSAWKLAGGSSSMYYANCNTSADNSTKVVAVKNLYELNVGTSIVVFFTEANTSTSVSLLVNSFGVKNVVNCVGSTEKVGNLIRGMCLFVYDGTNFVLLHSVATRSQYGLVKLTDTVSTSDSTEGIASTPKMVSNALKLLKVPKWAECSTDANVAAKKATAYDFELSNGTSFILFMTKGNSSINPTLSVNGSKAYPIVDKRGSSISGINVNQTSLLQGACLVVFYGSKFYLVDNIAMEDRPGLVTLTDDCTNNFLAVDGVAVSPYAVYSYVKGIADKKAALKHASQHYSNGSDPITPSNIGAYSKSETYSKEETNSAISKAINNAITGAISTKY